jgi:hypothetical protein
VKVLSEDEDGCDRNRLKGTPFGCAIALYNKRAQNFPNINGSVINIMFFEQNVGACESFI